MADNLTKKQRSYCMSRIRSKWTKPETTIHNKLKFLFVKHQMHPRIEGKPDIILKDRKVAVFIQGCYWHRCSKCYKESASNKKYWLPKIQNNVKRDRKNAKVLRDKGFRVVQIWEHEIKENPYKAICRILK